MHISDARRTLKAMLVVPALLLLIGAMPLTTASTASAAPLADRFCKAIDEDPTPEGVLVAGFWLMSSVETEEEIDAVLATAFNKKCPQHQRLAKKMLSEFEE